MPSSVFRYWLRAVASPVSPRRCLALDADRVSHPHSLVCSERADRQPSRAPGARTSAEVSRTEKITIGD